MELTSNTLLRPRATMQTQFTSSIFRLELLFLVHRLVSENLIQLISVFLSLKKNHNTENKKQTTPKPPKNNLTNIYVVTIKIKVLNILIDGGVSRHVYFPIENI